MSTLKSVHIATLILTLAPVALCFAATDSAKTDSNPAETIQQSLKDAFISKAQAAKWQLNSELQNAYLDMAKQTALSNAGALSKHLPADFLEWIDSDPIVRTTVYASRSNPLPVLVHLRALELGLGEDTIRKEYTQFALAMAVNASYRGWPATAQSQNDSRSNSFSNNLPDLAQITPYNLVIQGDPRVKIDTKDTTRPLTLNDHIINFLEDHDPISVEMKTHELEPLEYDDKGIAKPRKKKAIVKTITRPLYAADVIASTSLQKEFNDYMKAHGQDISINCGDKIVHWYSTKMVRGENRKNIEKAFQLFKTAYEKTGRLPAGRDLPPTPIESMAWFIRNDSQPLANTTRKHRWPLFSLNAPWPILMMLADDTQPLREREEIWKKFSETGEARTYGEYIYGIAQQFNMQSARRLSPFDFSYGSIQMMWKDGGVCGAMATMGARTFRICGIPSCTAGQPRHCALIYMTYNPKTKIYYCQGGQYATGGDEVTTPHYNWNYDDHGKRRPMVYHQSIPCAVNLGLPSYLETLTTTRIYQLMPSADKQTHGLELLKQGLHTNPFSMELIDLAFAQAADTESQASLIQELITQIDKQSDKQNPAVCKLLRDALNARIKKETEPQKK